MQQVIYTNFVKTRAIPTTPAAPATRGGPRASRGLEILEYHVENETKGNERASCGGASEVVGLALVKTRS